jgi:uncharacterized tellurite resistance protein B-like protein
MFNFRKKPQEEQHPISSLFSDLSQNQRMSVINILATVAFANGEDGIQQKVKILNSFLGYLGVRGDKCDDYLKKTEIEGMLSDLNTLSKNQKEFLVISAQDIIMCSRQASEKEIVLTAQMFEELGIDEHQFIAICQKARALMKHFS